MELTGNKFNGLREFANFRLDAEKRVLWAGESLVDLPPRAIDVLCVLTEQPGEVVSKAELINAVWKESFVEESNLTHQIYELRKTFKEYGCEEDLIQTVSRRGYRFTGKVTEIFLDKPETLVERRTISRALIEELIDHEPMVQIPSPEALAPLAIHLPPQRRPWLSALIAILVVGSIGSAIFGYWLYTRPSTSTAAGPLKSIAVLPFKQFESTEDPTLGLRIADSLITRLGSMKSISVRPTSAITKFSDADPIQAGREMSVDAVLEGRIHREGDNLRLNIQLISVGSGDHIWSGQFNGKYSSLLDLQDAVGRSIAASIDPVPSQNTTAQATASAAAYDKYLLGRYHWNTRTEEGFNNAIGFFEQAVTLDPQFAQAYAGLGDAYVGLYDYGIKPADECIPKARAALNRSIQIRPESAEAFSTLAAIQFLYDRNTADAITSIERSISIDQNYPTARLRYGWMLTMLGRFAEAKTQLEKARELDPTSGIVQGNIGYLSLVTGNDAEAEKIFREVIGSNPKFSLPHWYLGGIYFHRGDRGAMFAEYLKAFEIDYGTDFSQKVEATLSSKGEAEALRELFQSVETAQRSGYMPPSNLALFAAISGDRAKTLSLLEEAEKLHDPWLLQIKYDHEYDFIRNEPRFVALMQKMNMK